jgi:PIN domain nuclease of toxin-antitoxin system
LRLLLDTYAAIWALVAPKEIPDRIRHLIGNEENEIFVSVVSLWEIAIKFSLYGSRRMPLSCAEAAEAFEQAGYTILQARKEHALAVEPIRLPHGDLFDRLILAQALSEPLTLVTKDRRLAAYSETIVSW